MQVPRRDRLRGCSSSSRSMVFFVFPAAVLALIRSLAILIASAFCLDGRRTTLFHLARTAWVWGSLNGAEINAELVGASIAHESGKRQAWNVLGAIHDDGQAHPSDPSSKIGI